MHLCDIPEDKIHAVEIPTGLPMLYDFKTKRIRLLEDNNEKSFLERYDFGHDPDLLFKRTIKPGQPTGVDNHDLSEVIIKMKPTNTNNKSNNDNSSGKSELGK